MKIGLCFLVLVPFIAQGKSLKDLSSAITRDVHQEIRKDEEKFKVRPLRAPASVSPVHDKVVEEPKKIDKTVRQIGPNSW